MQYPSNFPEILSLLRNLSFQAMGYSSPNPPVGCVITDLDGKILSSGHTQKTGGNHAEREAYQNFAKAYPDNKKIPHLVFVTLEPCTHLGRTPPCLDLILENLPVSVYYGLSDPNPLVKNRNGWKECEIAGIKIIQSPEIAEIGRAFLCGFISRMELGRPQIFLKSALSKEGYYSDLAKSKIPLSNSKSQRITQMLRAKLDAVVVGPVTVYVDFPGLDFRGFDLAEKIELENENQKKTIISQDEKKIFTQTLFENIADHDSLEQHISKLPDYQPFRIFLLSLKRIPDLGFFSKQGMLNEKLGSKKVIFFLLDFEADNSSHQNLYEKMLAISFEPPAIVIDREDLKLNLFSKFSELSLNTILVEGGNLLYRLFSKNLSGNDLIYFIRTEKSIKEGILPEIDIGNLEKYFEIKMDTDLWEVYGE